MSTRCFFANNSTSVLAYPRSVDHPQSVSVFLHELLPNIVADQYQTALETALDLQNRKIAGLEAQLAASRVKQGEFQTLQ